ncbi:MAG: nucleoside deaminase [Pseudomonadota bacterium]
MKRMHNDFIKRASDRAKKGMLVCKGGPFGAVIVKKGVVVAEAHNEVTSSNDPTAHAEVLAIRRACRKLNTFNLRGCDIYCSSEPCPMCMGAIYWARLSGVFYACAHNDAAKAGFDDGFIYRDIKLKPSKRKIKFRQIKHKDAEQLFKLWNKIENKTLY